tara:strand:+ start:404 stop:676 length:273 start_codon:yes stop_codon:yes gene_type:complete
MYRPFTRKFLTEGRIRWALNQTLSLTKACELLDVSYPTFKKYAKMYKDEEGVSLFDKHKNQSGKGINKKKMYRRDRFGKKIHISDINNEL